MRAEILFPEVCNLYGDLQCVYYLKQCVPGLEIVETGLKDKPLFLDEKVELVFMASTTEQGLELAAQALRPYRAELEAKVAEGQLMLFVGNTPDLLCQSIEADNGWSMEGLGLLPGHAKYRMMNRHNSFFLGTFEGMDIVGFKSLFGHIHGAPEGEGLFHVTRGVGRDGKGKEEGWRRNNLMATHLIGPLLVLNPPFTRYILELMDAECTDPAFEEAAMEAYRVRVAEFSQENRDFMYH